MKKNIESELLKSLDKDKEPKTISPRIRALNKIKQTHDIDSLPKEELDKLITKEIQRYKLTSKKQITPSTLDDIDTNNAINELLNYHLQNKDKLSKTNSLLVIYKCKNHSHLDTVSLFKKTP